MLFAARAALRAGSLAERALAFDDGSSRRAARCARSLAALRGARTLRCDRMFFSRNRRFGKAYCVAIADTADAPEAPAMQTATMTERIIVLELRQVANRRAPWSSRRRIG